MAVPLLPLLMFGTGLGVQEFQRRGRQEQRQQLLDDRNAQLDSLVGQAGMQGLGGSGFLSDPTNLQNQIQFASGLLQVPGYETQGASLLNNFLDQNQAERQYQQTFDYNRAIDANNAQLQAEQLARDLADRQRSQFIEETEFGEARLNQRLGQEEAIRKDAISLLQPYQQMQTAYEAVVSGLASGESGFDAISNVIGFMKVFDPTVSVTEGESGLVFNAEGPLQGLMNQLNTQFGKKGEKGFGPETRTNIARTLFRRIQPFYENATRIRQNLEQRAVSQGLQVQGVMNPNIFGNLGINWQPPQMPNFMGATTNQITDPGDREDVRTRPGRKR